MGNSFVHVELNTTSVPDAKEFYGSLFDWKLQDVQGGPESPYTMIDPGAGTGGGMLKHPMPGEPSFWLPYVEVEDIRAMTDKAVGLGAELVRDVTEVPGRGWLSIFTDPTGATLGLWKPAGPGKK